MNFLLSKGGDKVIYHFDIVKRRRIICTLSILLMIDIWLWWWFWWYLIMVMILRYDDNLWVILLNLYLRWCLLLGGDFVEISIRTTWVTNFLLLFFSFTFSFLWWRGRRIHVFKFIKICYFFLYQLSFSFWWWGGENPCI